MQGSELADGERYAYRAKATRTNRRPFSQVVYLGACRSRQAHVRHVGGDLDGLAEWVPMRLLICPWAEREAMARDEDRLDRLEASSADVWDRVVEDAISTVMEASGEYGGFMRTWLTDEATAHRFWQRAGCPGTALAYDAVNFIDRRGMWHLSFATAAAAAASFAAQNSELVELYVRSQEESLKEEGFQPGNRFAHESLRRSSPSFALALSWTSANQRTALEHELDRLQGLVREAIRLLRSSGDERNARRLERALAGK